MTTGHILFPCDFSAQSSEVVRFVRAMAQALQAHLDKFLSGEFSGVTLERVADAEIRHSVTAFARTASI